MLFWHAATLLALEASSVISMRLQSLAFGQSTPNEMLLMFTEKVDAIGHAQTIVVRGGDPAQVIEHYRKIVGANINRLSG
jgi:hypothetical protein